MKRLLYNFSLECEELMIDNFIKRYHFDEKDTDLIRSTGIFLTSLLSINAIIDYQEEQIVCAVTLGKEFDDLENLVTDSGHLLLSYCMECFGMEFLSKAYEKMNEAVYAECGRFIGDYCFFNPEMAGEYEEMLKGVHIKLHQGMLRPLKSVLFSAKYRNEKADSGCHSCENCENITCSFREKIQKSSSFDVPVGVKTGEMKEQLRDGQTKKSWQYSYGIAQIMGNREK